jgi:hypothetical protein
LFHLQINTPQIWISRDVPWETARFDYYGILIRCTILHQNLILLYLRRTNKFTYLTESSPCLNYRSNNIWNMINRILNKTLCSYKGKYIAGIKWNT